jgi:hypothetical protein
MSRLEAELQRLHFSASASQAGATRAMVLELAGPAAWEQLARAWQGVQADLELPAPGIAVNGVDGYQLWFSLAEAVPVARAAAFLASLRRRYLAEAKPERVRLKSQPQDFAGVPPFEHGPGRWSAFIAPDLATMFAEESWLDLPPGPEAQAEQLSRLRAIQPADWQRAVEQLRRDAAATSAAQPAATVHTEAQEPDPRRFLLQVMNDPAIELHLRIEAAKALLPYVEGQRGG